MIGLGVLFGFASSESLPASAEARASKGRKGLSTKVNGRQGGRCRSGVCRISGGMMSVAISFTALASSIRGKIKRIEFDPGRQKSDHWHDVTQRDVSETLVSLSRKSNVYWLSPAGIHLGRGVGFVHVPRLTLSTARPCVSGGVLMNSPGPS